MRIDGVCGGPISHRCRALSGYTPQVKDGGLILLSVTHYASFSLHLYHTLIKIATQPTMFRFDASIVTRSAGSSELCAFVFSARLGKPRLARDLGQCDPSGQARRKAAQAACMRASRPLARSPALSPGIKHRHCCWPPKLKKKVGHLNFGPARSWKI